MPTISSWLTPAQRPPEPDDTESPPPVNEQTPLRPSRQNSYDTLPIVRPPSNTPTQPHATEGEGKNDQARSKPPSSTLARMASWTGVDQLHWRWYISGVKGKKIVQEAFPVGISILETAFKLRMVEIILPGVLSKMFRNLGASNAQTASFVAGFLLETAVSRALSRQTGRALEKEAGKVAKLITSTLGQPTLPEEAAIRASTVRAKSADVEATHPNKIIRESLENLRLAMDRHLLKPKNPDPVDHKNIHHVIDAWELMLKLSEEKTVDISRSVQLPSRQIEREAFLKRQKELKQAQSDIETRAKKDLTEGGKTIVENFLNKWRASSSEEAPKQKSLIAVVGDSDLPEYICARMNKALANIETKTKKTSADAEKPEAQEKFKPVKVNMNDLVEFVNVQLSKEAKPRLKQKTADPKKQLGPFHDWIMSGNASGPIIIEGVDPKNAEHKALLEKLADPEFKEILLHYDHVQGVIYPRNIESTPIIIRLSEEASAELQQKIPHVMAKPPTEAKRKEFLETILDELKGGLETLVGHALTDEEKEVIDSTLRQEKYKRAIVRKCTENDLSLAVMKEVTSEIWWHATSAYIGEYLDNCLHPSVEAPPSSSRNAEENAHRPFDNVRKELEKTLEDFIKESFKARPKKKATEETSDKKKTDKDASEKKDEAKASTTANGTTKKSRLDEKLSRLVDLPALQEQYPSTAVEPDITKVIGKGKKINEYFKLLPATPLHGAVEDGDMEALQRLLNDDETDLNKADKRKNTPLILAIKNENIEAARTLAQHWSIDLDKQDASGNTALHIAIEKKNLELVQILLEQKHKGIDFELKNKNDETVMMAVAKLYSTHREIFNAVMKACEDSVPSGS